MTLFRATAGMFAFTLISTFAAGRAQAQTVSLQAELLSDWAKLKDTMHKLAAEMPPEKYNYKPSDGQQTFGERVVHVAQANVGLLSAMGGTTAKPAIDAKATSKEAAIKALDDSFDYGTAVLKLQTDQTLMQVVAGAPKWLGPASGTRLVTFVAGHAWDIYGQLAVYLRLNGKVPPASQKM